MAASSQDVELRELEPSIVSDNSSESDEPASYIGGSSDEELSSSEDDSEHSERSNDCESDKESSCSISSSHAPSNSASASSDSGDSIESSSGSDRTSEASSDGDNSEDGSSSEDESDESDEGKSVASSLPTNTTSTNNRENQLAIEAPHSQEESSSSEDESEEPEVAESVASSIPTISINNKGKQRTTDVPRSIIKQDTDKGLAVGYNPDIDHKNKPCTRCDRRVTKPFARRLLPPAQNLTEEEHLHANTIYNLEGYHTDDPITIPCDRCSAVASALDQYKGVTVEGEKFVKSRLANTVSKKYRFAVLERERAVAEYEKRKSVSSNSPSAAVQFKQLTTSGTDAGASDAASTASAATSVSFGPLPPPTDGVGAMRRNRKFNRSRGHYKPGRWSWEAVLERGDLEEYDYTSSGKSRVSETGAAGESSAQGAAGGAAQDTEGWLDTSGKHLSYNAFYAGIPDKKGKQPNNTQTHTVRRKKERSCWSYLKELFCGP